MKKEKINASKRFDWGVLFIIVLYIIIHSFVLFNFHAYGWDESTYIHTARYILSGGKEGFVEPLRPVLFSGILVLLGASMKMALLFNILLSAAVLYIVHKIAKEFISYRYAWIVPAILAIFPWYYVASEKIWTDMLALFFHTLSIYFFFKKKYTYTATFGVLSFLTRFTYGIYLPILFIGMLYTKTSTVRQTIKNIKKYIKGGLLGAIPILLHIVVFYPTTKNIITAIFFPIINQLKDHTASSYRWLYEKGAGFYIQNMWDWTPMIILIIAGILYILITWKKKSTQQEKVLLFLALIPFLYLSITWHKESRYLLLCIPWIIVLLVYSIQKIADEIEKAKKYRKYYVHHIILILLLFWCIYLGVTTYNNIAQQYEDPQSLYINYYDVLANEQNVTILTTMPMINTKATIIPAYYNEKYFEQKLKEQAYDYIYYTDVWFYCQKEDQQCHDAVLSARSYIEEHYNVHTQYVLGQTEFYIWQKKAKKGK